MISIKDIKLPDIGDFKKVEVVEILVNVGDKIAIEDSIITIESDKASMEIPAVLAGTVIKINVGIGDKVAQGDVILSLKEEVSKSSTKSSQVDVNGTNIVPVNIPDIGDFKKVEVIEILVSVGDEIAVEDSIITIESDKASMEIPTATAGVVNSIKLKLGDKVGLGDTILELVTKGVDAATEDVQDILPSTADINKTNISKPLASISANKPFVNTSLQNLHASPSVRKLARELSVDLAKVFGTGKKNRILSTDLKAYVKQIVSSIATTNIIPSVPVPDFSKFGKTEIKELSRINKISGKHIVACWLNIPHVTQFDEVNIDRLESFRQMQKAKGVKLTPLVFIMKAVVKILKKYPRFNSSLDDSGAKLIVKKYFNLGIAMDTKDGLVVPVVRDVDRKTLTGLAKELVTISTNARAGKLKLTDMQGASFTISNLGGIGGTQFTPIVNAPEVAILGVSRSQIKPTWDGKKFIPTLILPLSLSYDHRVIDGVYGANFMASLNSVLTDIREILL